MSLYQKYGGAAGVSKVVRDFYDLVLDDSDLNRFFKKRIDGKSY